MRFVNESFFVKGVFVFSFFLLPSFFLMNVIVLSYQCLLSDVASLFEWAIFYLNVFFFVFFTKFFVDVVRLFRWFSFWKILFFAFLSFCLVLFLDPFSFQFLKRLFGGVFCFISFIFV